MLVRRVRRLSGEELGQALTAHLSGDGKMAVFGDGLVVVCDRVQVLERVADMLDAVEKADSPVWCVQLHLVALSDTDSRALGLENTPSLSVAAAFAGGSSVAAASSASASAGLSSVLHCVDERGGSSVVGQPCFLLADGGSAKFARTRKVPVANSTINAATGAATTTTNYTYVDVGLAVKVDLRERGERSALLTATVTITDQDGTVNDVPITIGEEYSTAAVVESGGVYLLGSCERKAQTRRDWSWLYWGRAVEQEKQTLYVWATAKVIGGSLGRANGRAAGRGDEGATPAAVVRLPAVR